MKVKMLNNLKLNNLKIGRTTPMHHYYFLKKDKDNKDSASQLLSCISLAVSWMFILIYTFSSFYTYSSSDSSDYDGKSCYPRSGSDNATTWKLNRKNISSPGNHQVDVYGASTVSVLCPCIKGDKGHNYYTAVNVWPGNDLDNGFRSIDKDTDISFDTYIWGDKNDYFRVPFNNVSDGSQQLCLAPPELVSTMVGARGKVNLRVRKLYSGVKRFSGAAFYLYMSRFNSSHVPTSVASRIVKVEGEIYSSVDCRLSNADQIFEFGDINITMLQNNKATISKELSLLCTNGNFANVSVFLLGQTVLARPELLYTTHKDIGIRLSDRNGKIIYPLLNNSIVEDYNIIETNLVGQSRVFNLNATVVPISMSRLAPSAGDFTSTATLGFMFD